MLVKVVSFAAFAALPALASAQSLNIDVASSLATAPSSSYGAALGQVGYWNGVPHGASSLPLNDLAGIPTSARASLNGCDSSSEDDPNITRDDAALLEDWANADCYADPSVFAISGLAAGTYIVTPYSYSVISPGLSTTFEVSAAGGQATSFTVPGHVFAGNYVDFPLPRATVTIASGQVVTVRTFGQSYNGIAGLQLTWLGGIDGFCFGDIGDCPCGEGANGRGCPSSFQPAGAVLSGSGAQQVSADTVVLTVSDVSNSVVTLFQGTQLIAGGRGTAFGDGLRCAGGSVIRIAAKLASGGVMSYPEAGEQAISVRGALPPAGGLRTYQIWYRNAADYCTTSTFNLSNGLAIAWQP